MKVGIVVPYSWSFWGGVVEHAAHQAQALDRLGIETRLIVGYDPPDLATRILHPRSPRTEPLPQGAIAIGRSVHAPGNGSLGAIVLTPFTARRVRATLDRERFDLLHLHEPIVPSVCTAALAQTSLPVVATFHAAGELRWHGVAHRAFGCLLERIDHRIAVSEAARVAAARRFPAEYEIVPNGALIPCAANGGDARRHRVVFVGRAERRKGLGVLIDAWAEVHGRTGARLRVVGAQPHAVRRLAKRAGCEKAVDALGALPDDELSAELAAAKILAAPSLGGESFGMVLTRALACGTPVVASDIPGYRDVLTAETGVLVAPGDARGLAGALVAMLRDEPSRRRMGAAGRLLVEERFGWDRIARRLASIYDDLLARSQARLTHA